MSTRDGELCVVKYLCCIFVDAGFRYHCTRSVRERGLGALGMSTRAAELCVLLNICCRIFVDVGFTKFCMGGVRGRGVGALGMSTRVSELCVCWMAFVEEFLMLVLRSFVWEVFAEGVWERLG